MFQKKIDAYLIFSETNRFYFTRLDTSFGCVLLTEKEKLFFTDFRYENVARSTLGDFTVVIVTRENYYGKILEQLKRLGVKSLGFEDEWLSVGEFKTIKSVFSEYSLKPASAELAEVRLIKNEEEIERIAAAQKIAEKALAKIVPLIKAGVTEREVSAELTFEMIKGGADGLAFDNIVAFGENSARPHHKPTDKKLDKNDLILIDFGAKAAGYCSDMTRTFCLGEPQDELMAVHGIVLEAQAYAIKHIKAGITGREADSFAREYIKANGYGNEFGHSLGHGVGIEIHEAPNLSVNSDIVLRPNMIITIEPGIYVDGLGGVRIEDLAVVQEDGIRNLTNFNKNLSL